MKAGRERHGLFRPFFAVSQPHYRTKGENEQEEFLFEFFASGW
jgi:hypothetical protein